MTTTKEATEAVRAALASNQTYLRTSPFPMQDMAQAIQLIEDSVDRLILLPSSSSSSSSSSSTSSPSSSVSSGVTVTVDSNMFDERPFILAEDVIAPVNIPFSNCSRLDGYALVADEGVGLFTVIVSRRAGDGTDMKPLNRGEVAYVTTGAPLPSGANAICKIEDTGLVYDSSGKYIPSSVNIKVATKPGEGVRKAGSDVLKGEVLLPAGHVLLPIDVGSLLLAKVRSVVRKRVASAALLFPTMSPEGSMSPILALDDGCIGILSTGDEIVDVSSNFQQDEAEDDFNEEEEDDEIEEDNRAYTTPHRDVTASSRVSDDSIDKNNSTSSASTFHTRIVKKTSLYTNKISDDFVWDSNKPMLSAMVRSHGFTPIDCGIAKDKGGVDAMCESILSAASTCRMLIITGGVSMGDKDHVKPALVKLGADILFGRLMMKPGKPCTCAILPRVGKQPLLIFALPGNPVSAAVCFNVLVVPALRRMSGLPWTQSRLTQVKVCLVGEAIQLDPERPEYHRATVWWANDIDGVKNFPSGVALCGRSTGAQASSRMQSVSNANALLCLPASNDLVKPGTILDALLIGTVYNRQAIPLSISTPPTTSTVVIQSSSCGGHHHHHDHHQLHHPSTPPSTSHLQTTHETSNHHHQHNNNQSARQPHVIESIHDNATPRRSISISIITISDSAFYEGAVDKSGPEILSILTKTYPQWDIEWVNPRPRSSFSENGVTEKKSSSLPTETGSPLNSFHSHISIVPDEYEAIKDILLECVFLDSHLVITTGGTGFGSRDITPEATDAVLDRKAPGLVHAMLTASLKHTPMAALSRYTAGTREKSLIINLPGSPKAVKECIEAISSVLPHAIALIRK